MLRTILIAAFFIKTSHSADILGIFYVPSKSHHILGSALLKELAKHGHNVTMVSPYPIREKVPNYQHVHIEEIHQFKEGTKTSKLEDLSAIEKFWFFF